MGPTGSGKTALAIKTAKAYGTEIISVDARQVYKEMTIGTAKPTSDQLQEVNHYFVDHLSVTQAYNAAAYANEANEVLNMLFQKQSVVVAGGGSTL
ncbi:MAG: AAA family ATPase, partial [Bacteroidota bacterium]|nr:AAA family ATPase [Bacteroidota bacterium]